MQVYRARNPKKSPLWQIPNRHYDEFEAAYPEAYEAKADLEDLAQYILHNPSSVEKMTLESPTDIVIYRSRLNAKINRNFEVFTATDFLAAITQHIPDPTHRGSATTAGTATRCAASATGACRRSWFRTARASHRRPPLNLPSKRWRDLILRVWHVGCSSPRRFGAGLLLGTGLFVPGPPQNRATSRALPGRSPDASQPPLGVTPKLTESRQTLSVATLGQV